MYAFRKAFSAATYAEEMQILGMDYKIWLVIAQMIGYTLSKFYGIKFISENKGKGRAKSILCLVLLSWVALLGLAIVPPPYNVAFMLLNGFPLGMIWGLVCSYLEGRKTSEFMGAVLATTLIFASGFVKTVGRVLMDYTGISALWMPFAMGFLFILPLIGFVLMLEALPPPTQEDVALRTKRVAMNGSERVAFVKHFLPGILATVVIYVLFTAIRDMRDNFEVEIWKGLGMNNNHIYTQIDTIISIVILILLSLLILVKNNLKAFMLIHVMIITGCFIIMAGTLLYQLGAIQAVVWMILVGIGLFMTYLPYNAVFFERLIATYHHKGNIGFLIYLADAFGYLASISILGVKELGNPGIEWLDFFTGSLWIAASLGFLLAIFSMIYFKRKATATQKLISHENPIKNFKNTFVKAI
jgi:MFS family permease